MEEKIMTQHPAGKSGANISKAKYNVIKAAIIETLQAHREMTFTTLTEQINKQLEEQFEGSIPWYVTTVKLDLEARRVLERVPKTSPQKLRLVV